VPKTSLSVTGDLNSYVLVQELDGEFTTYFCPKCATKIYMTPMARDDYTDTALIGAGTLSPDDFAALNKPDTEIFTKYRVDWLHELEGTDQFKENIARREGS